METESGEKDGPEKGKGERKRGIDQPYDAWRDGSAAKLDLRFRL